MIPSKVQALTSVGLEHTRWLGPTVADIAGEKLAVVRDHGTLVVGPLDPASAAVAERVAAERHAALIRAPADAGVPLRAPGGFQRQNFALALAAAEAFVGSGELRFDSVEAAAGETTIPGGVEIVDEAPRTVYDGAPNPAGARAWRIRSTSLGARGPRGGHRRARGQGRRRHAGELLPHVDRAIYTRSADPRSLSPGTLGSLAEKLDGPPSEAVADPRAAVARARELAGPDGAVLATGSTT